MDVSEQDLLGTAFTADYIPFASYSHFVYSRNVPPFTYDVIRRMLTDPRIVFGLCIIKGTLLSRLKFTVEASDTQVQKFVEETAHRFLRNSAHRILKALDWGYSGSEVLYKRAANGLITFDVIRDLDPVDTRPVTYNGEVVGITVNNVPFTNSRKGKIFLGGPKGLWHVHGREHHPWFGRSRLYGTHVPWWETWSDGGFRDIRRLWFYRNAFEGGTMYHPPGAVRLEDGTTVSAKQLAREIVEKKRTGSAMAFENMTDERGNRRWEYIPPSPVPVPAGLLEYGEILRTEEFEGLGIPPEIIESQADQSQGTSSGRSIPLLSFYASLTEMGYWLLSDFDTQVIRALTLLNYGNKVQYRITPLPITETEDFQAANPNQYGDEAADGSQPNQPPGLNGNGRPAAQSPPSGKPSPFGQKPQPVPSAS